MSVATASSPIQPESGLLGQTVVVIGGSAGIGLETARRARAEGAKLILAARNPERLEQIDNCSQVTAHSDLAHMPANRIELQSPRIPFMAS
jgi:NADP-dependent 3-hydroxy acid dehydrogenase YdfG